MLIATALNANQRTVPATKALPFFILTRFTNLLTFFSRRYALTIVIQWQKHDSSLEGCMAHLGFSIKKKARTRRAFLQQNCGNH